MARSKIVKIRNSKLGRELRVPEGSARVLAKSGWTTEGESPSAGRTGAADTESARRTRRSQTETESS